MAGFLPSFNADALFPTPTPAAPPASATATAPPPAAAAVGGAQGGGPQPTLPNPLSKRQRKKLRQQQQHQARLGSKKTPHAKKQPPPQTQQKQPPTPQAAPPKPKQPQPLQLQWKASTRRPPPAHGAVSVSGHTTSVPHQATSPPPQPQPQPQAQPQRLPPSQPHHHAAAPPSTPAASRPRLDGKALIAYHQQQLEELVRGGQWPSYDTLDKRCRLKFPARVFYSGDCKEHLLAFRQVLSTVETALEVARCTHLVVTLKDVEAEVILKLRGYEGFEAFEQLGVGSIVHHPLAKQFFNIPADVTTTPDVTTARLFEAFASDYVGGREPNGSAEGGAPAPARFELLESVERFAEDNGFASVAHMCVLIKAEKFVTFLIGHSTRSWRRAQGRLEKQLKAAAIESLGADHDRQFLAATVSAADLFQRYSALVHDTKLADAARIVARDAARLWAQGALTGPSLGALVALAVKALPATEARADLLAAYSPDAYAQQAEAVLATMHDRLPSWPVFLHAFEGLLCQALDAGEPQDLPVPVLQLLHDNPDLERAFASAWTLTLCGDESATNPTTTAAVAVADNVLLDHALGLLAKLRDGDGGGGSGGGDGTGLLPLLDALEAALLGDYGLRSTEFPRLAGGSTFLRFCTRHQGQLALEATLRSGGGGDGHGDQGFERRAAAWLATQARDDSADTDALRALVACHFDVLLTDAQLERTRKAVVGPTCPSSSQGAALCTASLLDGKALGAVRFFSSPAFLEHLPTDAGSAGRASITTFAARCAAQVPLLMDIAAALDWRHQFQASCGPLGAFLAEHVAEAQADGNGIAPPAPATAAPAPAPRVLFSPGQDEFCWVPADSSLSAFVEAVAALRPRLAAAHAVGLACQGSSLTALPTQLLADQVLLQLSKQSSDTASAAFAVRAVSWLPFNLRPGLGLTLFLVPASSLVSEAELPAHCHSFAHRLSLLRLLALRGSREVGFEPLVDGCFDESPAPPQRADAHGAPLGSPLGDTTASEESVPPHSSPASPDNTASAAITSPSSTPIPTPTPAPAPAATPDAAVSAAFDDIYAQYGLAFVTEPSAESKAAMGHLRALAERSIERLAGELYSDDIHFLLELVQNADDNSYPSGVVPRLDIGVDTSAITFGNNEVGFSAKHVKALCSIGQSTKGKHSTGYIGHKGIGFKSVFRVSQRPQVHSCGFHFQFDASSGGLGYIIPQVLPEPAGWGPESGTRFVLPLPAAVDAAAQQQQAPSTAMPLSVKDLRARLGELHPCLLLFLNRLRHISFHDAVAGTQRTMERLDSDLDVAAQADVLSGVRCALVTIVQSHTTPTADSTTGTSSERAGDGPMEAREEGTSSRTTWLKTSWRLAGAEGIGRHGQTETELVVCLPYPTAAHHDVEDTTTAEGTEDATLAAAPTARPPLQDVFAFLPVRSYGFRFVLQADWVLTSSREALDASSSWNQWLREQLPRLFRQAVELMLSASDPAPAAEGEGQPQAGVVDTHVQPRRRLRLANLALSMVPLPGEVSDFFAATPAALLRELRKASFVLTAAGHLTRPQACVFRPPGGQTDWACLAGALAVLDLAFAHPGLHLTAERAAALGIRVLNADLLMQILTALSMTWASAEASFDAVSLILSLLSKDPGLSRVIPGLRAVAFLPLADGTTSSLDDGPVFELLDGSLARKYAFLSQLRVVHPGLRSAVKQRYGDSALACLARLGVERTSGHRFVAVHVRDLLADPTTPAEHLVSALAFAKAHLAQSDQCSIQSFAGARLVDANGRSHAAPYTELHLHPKYLQGQSAGALTLAVAGALDWALLSPDYLAVERSSVKSWRDLFLGLGLPEFVRVSRLERSVPLAELTVADGGDGDGGNLLGAAAAVVACTDVDSADLRAILDLLGSHGSINPRVLWECVLGCWADLRPHAYLSVPPEAGCTAKVPSTLLSLLRDSAWVPVSDGKQLRKPGQVYTSDRARELLRDPTLIVQDFKGSQGMAEALGLRGKPTPEELLAILQGWAGREGPQRFSLGQAMAIYGELASLAPEAIAGAGAVIVPIVARSEVPEAATHGRPTVTFRSAAQEAACTIQPTARCVWQDPSKLLERDYGLASRLTATALGLECLAAHYPKHCRSALVRLGVKPVPSLSDYGRALANITRLGPPTHDGLVAVYRIMANFNYSHEFEFGDDDSDNDDGNEDGAGDAGGADAGPAVHPFSRVCAGLKTPLFPVLCAGSPRSLLRWAGLAEPLVVCDAGSSSGRVLKRFPGALLLQLPSQQGVSFRSADSELGRFYASLGVPRLADCLRVGYEWVGEGSDVEDTSGLQVILAALERRCRADMLPADLATLEGYCAGVTVLVVDDLEAREELVRPGSSDSTQAADEASFRVLASSAAAVTCAFVAQKRAILLSAATQHGTGRELHPMDAAAMLVDITAAAGCSRPLQKETITRFLMAEAAGRAGQAPAALTWFPAITAAATAAGEAEEEASDEGEPASMGPGDPSLPKGSDAADSEAGGDGSDGSDEPTHTAPTISAIEIAIAQRKRLKDRLREEGREAQPPPRLGGAGNRDAEYSQERRALSDAPHVIVAGPRPARAAPPAPGDDGGDMVLFKPEHRAHYDGHAAIVVEQPTVMVPQPKAASGPAQPEAAVPAAPALPAWEDLSAGCEAHYPLVAAAGSGASARQQDTGRMGEQLVYEYLCHSPAFHDVEWENQAAESGRPFDLTAYRTAEDGVRQQVFFEVKSSVHRKKRALELSLQELDFARDARDRYSIVQVLGIGAAGRAPTVQRLPDPAGLLEAGGAQLLFRLL